MIVKRQIDSPVQKSMDLASHSSGKEKWQKASLCRLSEAEQRYEKGPLSFAKDR
jgi:hypothetical protein